MSCRTQGGISRRPSVLPSFRPPPWPSKPQFCSLRPDFGPLSHQISPFRPQFSPWELKSALWTSYMPSRPQISPPDLKSALQASNQTFRPQICPLGLKPAPQTSNLLFWTKFCHPDFKSTSGRLEIHPLCPTGHRSFGATALLSLHFYSWSLSRALGTADPVQSSDDLLVFFFCLFWR